MAVSRVGRLAGPGGIVAAVLAVAALVLFVVVVGSDPISKGAEKPAFYAPTLAALGSIIALLVALIALFARQSEQLGTLGIVGFVSAVIGTALGVGGTWTYVFVLPFLSQEAPGVGDESSGSLLVGFVVSYLLMGVGWLLFAVATLKTGVFPRWAVILLMVGAVVAIIPMPSRTLVLALGAACMGYAAQDRTNEAPS